MLKRLLAAGAVSALMVGGAAAADLVLVPPTVDDPAVSDWDGVYAGLTGTVWLQGVAFPGVGVRIGANMVSDNLLFGVLADGRYYVTSGNFGGEVAGRIGYLISDDALIYGKAGVGALSNGSTYLPLGGGVEFKVAESLSLDLTGEYLLGNGFSATQFTASLNWHF